MSKKKKNIPKLRFPEFSEEWESKKLGEVTAWKSGGTPSMSRNEYWNGDIPWISASSMLGTEYSNSEAKITVSGLKAGSTLAKKGELLLLVRGSMLFRKIPIGITLTDVAFNQDVKAISASVRISNRFLLNWFLSKEVNIKNLVTVTGIGAGKLDTIGLVTFPISFPSLPEQKKIANFLTSIDERIQTLKKKKNLLEQYKKSMMQKIFSQQIRFKDEKGKNFPEWESKKLRDIISKFVVPMRDKPKDLGGEIAWCRIEDMDGKYLHGSKSNQGVSVKTVKEMNLKIFPVDTLLVSCSANLGFCSIVKKELVTNQTFIGLVTNKSNVNVEFLYYVMTLSARRLNVMASGTTISYLSREQFEIFEISIPSLPEQKKIADFLSSIDDKIDHCNKEIEKTESYKKGLLQKMFV